MKIVEKSDSIHDESAVVILDQLPKNVQALIERLHKEAKLAKSSLARAEQKIKRLEQELAETTTLLLHRDAKLVLLNRKRRTVLEF